MKILAINLRPDVTQIVEAKIKKNSLTIERVDSINSIFPALLSFKQEAIEDFFLDLLGHIKNKSADVYLGIPDDLIKKIDCTDREYILPEEWDSIVTPWMTQYLKVEKNDYYVITPLHIQKSNKSIITGMAIRSTYIDGLFKGATSANLNIKSLEPSCYGILRLLNQWDREHCIMEVWERSTSVTGYSPIKGMFKIDFSMGWSHYLQMENGSDELCKCIAQHDYTAFKTYGTANTDIPIYLVSDKSRELLPLLQNSEFAFRLQRLLLPEPFIQSKIFNEELLPYGIPLGLALAPLHERMIEYADTTS